MKQRALYALAASLLMIAGCKKGEDGSTEMMSKDEVAEKTQGVAVEVSTKAEEVSKKVAEETKATVSALAVKTEDVMADLNQSVEQIKEKVAGFDKTQLLAYADQYKTVLLEKKDQIASLTESLKGLPMTEMMGDKAKALKDSISQYTGEITALKDRYAVYLDKLETFGVDLSAYGL